MFEASEFQSLRFNLINIDSVVVGPDWKYSGVYSPFHRLYLVKNGEGVLHHHGRDFPLTEGSLHLVPSYTLHSNYCESYLEVAYIHFACEMEGHFNFFSDYQFQHHVDASELDYLLFDVLLKLNPSMGLIEENPDNYDRQLHMHRAENYIEEVPPPVFIETKGIVLQFLSRFMPLLNEVDTIKGHEDFHTIEESIRYLRENIDQPITVKELADHAMLNVDYFSRIFSRVMGARPIEFVNRKRIQRAKLLFLTTNSSLEQVALRTGFSSGRYLSRVFYKYVGLTPTEYRKAAHYS